MITIFATPKPFDGHIGIIQRNAIRSWRALSPDLDIILLGSSAGCVEAAAAVGARHAPVRCNEQGTPYLDDMFRRAERMSAAPVLCYVNADIILPGDFIDAVRLAARRRRFLMVGCRYDLDWSEPVEFGDAAAAARFWGYAQAHAVRHSPSGIDYFVFSRGLWGDIPAFLAGRPGFDNWLIWRARRLSAAVIDATERLIVVHQNHDYSHHPQGWEGIRQGEEAQHNRRLHGGCVMNILDAPYILTESGVRRDRSEARRRRVISRLPQLYPEVRGLMELVVRGHRALDRRIRRLAAG